MSMSTHIIGIKPPDEKWKKMKAVWDACQAAETEVPKDVGEFFGWEPPNDKGVEVEIKTHESVEVFKTSYQSGYDINVKELPPDVAIVRVYNSW